MRFLRERRGEPEVARQSDRYDAADRCRALTVLSGCIVIVGHPYEQCPYSGAGNCWCGRAEQNALHRVMVIEPGQSVLDLLHRS